MPGYGKEKRRYKGSKKANKKKSKKNPNVNNLSIARIRPVAYARELYCKLKSVKMEDANVPLGSSLRRFFLGNSVSIYPPQGALTAFAAPNVVVPAGEILFGGIPEYASFYDKVRMPACKINLQCFLTTNSADSFVRAVMIPIGPNPDGVGDEIQDMINQLDAYTFEQLMTYPQAQYRQIAIQTGGYAKFTFKSFRKAKAMLSFKDIRDEEPLNNDMPTSTGASPQRPSSTYQWGWYVRWFNDTAALQTIKYTVTAKGYFNFNKRRYVQGITAS